MIKYFDAPIEFDTKSFGEAGTFEGYAAIFGNIDLGGDIIERGAFKEFHKNHDGRIIVLNQHNTRDPIGSAEVEQDDKGLKFKGALVLEAASARTAYALMRAKVLSGMSMGYDVIDGGAKILESGIRQLKALKLYEISPVTFGMNPLASVTDVKSALRAGRMPSLDEFEDFLREAGFSRTEAKGIANHGLGKLLRREAGGESEEEKVVREALAILGVSSPQP